MTPVFLEALECRSSWYRQAEFLSRVEDLICSSGHLAVAHVTGATVMETSA
jgi:hypothetical protein